MIGENLSKDLLKIFKWPFEGFMKAFERPFKSFFRGLLKALDGLIRPRRATSGPLRTYEPLTGLIR